MLCTPCAVLAHGDPAAVLSVVRAGRDGRPELMRLSEGMALRNAGRTRYLCPARFDSDTTPRAAALAHGTTLVASSGGVYLLFADGAVERHPDSKLQTATLSALEASAVGGAFALAADADGTQLLAVDAERAQVLAELPAALTTLAVGDEAMLVAGLTSAGRVVQRGFEHDGAERGAWNAEASAALDSAAAFARLAGSRPYVVVAATNALGSELVQLDPDGAYRVMQRAGSPISGPIGVGTRTWFAFDGRLAELRAGDEVARVDDGPIVTCVGRSGPLPYACANNELRVLRDGALGERLFGLDEIAPPDVDGLDSELAERCTLQWLRFRVDLVAAGVTPNDAEPGPPGSSHGDRDGGTAVDEDAGARRDAGNGGGVKSDGGGAQDDGASGGDGGCGCASVGSERGQLSGRERGGRSGWLILLVVALAALGMRHWRALRRSD